MKILKVVGICIIIFFIIGILLLLFLTKQNKELSTNLSCEQLRECVELDYFCVDRFVENNLFGIKWSFSDKAFISDQKDYYKINCIEFLK